MEMFQRSLPDLFHGARTPLSLVVLVTASFTANADAVFGPTDLQSIASILEESKCIVSCETPDWHIQAVMSPPGSDRLIGPKETIFHIGGKRPNQCGAHRCVEAYILRDPSDLRILKSGYDTSRQDPLTASDIPPMGSRAGLPSVRRTLTQLTAPVVQLRGIGSCQSTAPIGVEGLLVRQAGELYSQAQRAPAGERPALLQRVLTIIDSLVQAQPQSQVACQVRQPGGQVGVIPVAQVRAELAGLKPANSTAPGVSSIANPTSTNSATASIAIPDTACGRLSPASNAIVRDLLKAYRGNLRAIEQAASHADHAVLAWAAYGGEDAIELARQGGWSEHQSSRNGGFTVPSELGGGDAVARLFFSAQGEAILAFRGTTTKKDWRTNAGIVLPIFSDQLRSARVLADRARALYPGVTFVGHSLGGAMAQVARLHTGRKAVIFNSAPIGLHALGMAISGQPLTSHVNAELVAFRSPEDPVRSATEVIGSFEDVVVGNIALTGNTVFQNVLEAAFGTGFAHDMKVLADAMLEVRLARDEEGWVDAYDCDQRSRIAVAAATPQIPMEISALGGTANSTAPVIEQRPQPSATSNEGGVATAMPASLEVALRRASTLGPSVDLAKAYMWSGQFDRGMQLLAAGALSTYPDSNGDLAQRRTGDYVDVADWLSTHGRTDLALRVLSQAEKGVGTTDWTKWSAIAKGYFRAEAVARARGILLRWERAIAASRVQRADPYDQDTQWLIETYKELGLVQDVRRLAGALAVDDCGYPFHQGGYRLQAYLGQHEQALAAARRCKDPIRQLVNEAAVGEIALGLAESSNFQAAQALLQRQRIDIASLYFFQIEHFGAAYARALGEAGRIEESRAMISRTRVALAGAAPGCHENYGDPVFRGLISLLEIGSTLEMPEQSVQTAQVARRHIGRLSRSEISNCAVDLVRFAQVLLVVARQDVMAGRIEQGRALVQEADALVAVGHRVGQRVLAGAQALAMVQRTPSRMPRLLNSNSEATGTAGVEQTLRTYIAQFPDGKFLAAGDSPEWNGGQCVAWAKALFGLVASRSIAGLGGHAGQLGGNLEKMGFQLSDDPATPRVGAMVVWRDGDFGHVSVVTQVHSNPGSNQITEITVSEANWGRITEAGARRWGLSLDQAKDPLVFVTEMYGVAQQTRLPVSNLNRGNYRFFAYVYP